MKREGPVILLCLIVVGMIAAISGSIRRCRTGAP
jgi:hypothetical protein